MLYFTSKGLQSRVKNHCVNICGKIEHYVPQDGFCEIVDNKTDAKIFPAAHLLSASQVMMYTDALLPLYWWLTLMVIACMIYEQQDDAKIHYQRCRGWLKFPKNRPYPSTSPSHWNATLHQHHHSTPTYPITLPHQSKYILYMQSRRINAKHILCCILSS